MVGLVVVSHSRALADELIRLVRQVCPKPIPVAVAGGSGEDRQEFGSDAMEIAESISSVYSSDGVLVLMDLGGALLSAETALEFIEADMRPNVRLCAGPLVEGAIAAGVQIGLGSDLNTVFEEARQALAPKALHLSGTDDPEPCRREEADTARVDEHSREIVLTLPNPHGLHARPCARFVQTAAGYDADVTVYNRTLCKGPVAAVSLNSLATLGAVGGHEILISAKGKEAAESLNALRLLVENGFGESADLSTAVSDDALQRVEAGTGRIQAIPISPGIAVGPLYHYQESVIQVAGHTIDDPLKEWQIFEKALAAAGRTIQKRRQRLLPTLGSTEAAIFEAHQLILTDPLLLDRVREAVFERRQNAAAAWQATVQDVAETYRSLPDAYLQQRAADIIDVGNQLLVALTGTDAMLPMQFPAPVVLVARELTPTQTAQLDLKKVLGLVTVVGGPNAHSAILARALGIPAIAGAGEEIRHIVQGTILAVDGFSGKLWVDPPPDILDEMQERKNRWMAQRRRLYLDREKPALTREGRRIIVAGNVGGLSDVDPVLRNGAEAVGLLRTEFLYLSRRTPPTEAEQLETLTRIGKMVGKRPIQIRTLDVGGDKSLPFIQLPIEANPYLGMRSVRLSLKQTELFSTQLRAILRAGADGNSRIMFPMITLAEELDACLQMLSAAHRFLAAQNISHRWPMETGIMIETPASALLASSLAAHVDFFSIGTNDLTQYTLAAERGNPELSVYADGLHPAVLQLIRKVVEAAHPAGKTVGVCGELAGDPVAIPVLVGLGVDELSMNAEGIPHAKAVIRALNMTGATSLAEKALTVDRASAVRGMAEEFIGKIENL